ncbi:NACHT domain-containing protein, partial [Candidatus Poribacteria bacterium]|nr:NACHT domain-containing protein [Candidatus Poribacteria bacterium]
MEINRSLKILLACSRPMAVRGNDSPLDIVRQEEELEAVRNGLQGLNQNVEVVVHSGVMLSDINRILMNSDPEFDILHLILHGTEDGKLYFEDESGYLRPVSPDELSIVIDGRVKMLVTMACHSGGAVNLLFDGDDPPVQSAVCIDQKHPVTVRAAEIFTGALYSGLARGRTLERSFKDAVGTVRLDDIVGEKAMPGSDEEPSQWKLFQIKGDDQITFPDVARGDVNISEAVEKTNHVKILLTEEIFVGRNADMARIIENILPPSLGNNKPKARIVTIVGEGGMGKTRIAQKVAEWLAFRGRFPGGIFEVACEGVNTSAGLAVEIMNSLDIEGAESIPNVETVLPELLKNYNLDTLLVLDNLDDLFSEDGNKAEAGRLLKACLTNSPKLRILATCRWRLDLSSDEKVYPLNPMNQIEAAKLFILSIPDNRIKRQLQQSLFETDKNSDFFKLINLTSCIPLCVILAARRLERHGQSLETLLEEAAEDMMNVMNDPGLAYLPDRLKSVRASLGLSYKRVSEPAKLLFARMSFFPGGLSRNLDLFELLGNAWKDEPEELTRYALVRFNIDHQRYIMLNPVMEYAKEKLDGMENSRDFRKKAAEYWAQFASWHDMMMDVRPASQTQVEQIIDLPEDPEERKEMKELLRDKSFAELSAEEDNLVHAAQWAL